MLPEPIHVVAGSCRSGTTAMMHALIEGSKGKLKPIHTPGSGRKFREVVDSDGWKFNMGVDELYELVACEECQFKLSTAWLNGDEEPIESCGDDTCYAEFSTHPERYGGRLMKLVNWKMPWCALPESPSGYRIVFLVRDFEEVFRSAEAAVSKNGTHIYVPTPRGRFNNLVYGGLTDMLHPRYDAQVRILTTRDFLTNAEHELRILELDGWPIDPALAATVIMPEGYRFRSEAVAV